MKVKLWQRILIIVGLPAIVYITFYLLQPSRFGNLQSLYIMFQQAFLPSIMAWGLFFILSLGLYDFSLGGIMVLGGIIGGVFGLMGNSISPILGYVILFITCIAISMLLGFINGIVYNKLKIPSMIVTVGLLMLYEIFAVLIPGTAGIGVSLYDSLSLFGRPPFNIIVGLLAMVVAYFLYNYSRIGIHIRAIGRNELMAKNMGVRIERTKVLGFVICGLFVGITGVLTLSYSSMMIPQTGLSSLLRIFTPLMGCFIGIVFRKYVNPIISIFVGEFTLIMIVTGLMTINIDATIQRIVIGVFLLLVAGITMRQKADIVVK